jgi:hypothetical protein
MGLSFTLLIPRLAFIGLAFGSGGDTALLPLSGTTNELVELVVDMLAGDDKLAVREFSLVIRVGSLTEGTAGCGSAAILTGLFGNMLVVLAPRSDDVDIGSPS